MPKLQPDVLDILANHLAIDPEKRRIRIDIRLDDQRDLYDRVARVLTDLGGTYRSSGKQQGAFIYQIDPSDLIGAVLETQEVNPLAFFATPKPVADGIVQDMDRVATECADLVALEPSAGQGVFVQALLDAGWPGQIVAIEEDLTNFRILQLRYGDHPQVVLVNGRFEDYDGSHGPFFVVVMNPPFGIGGKATVYIEHIRRAYGMLHPGGQLRAIAPVNWRFRNDRVVLEFADLIHNAGEHEDLPKGSFQQSGTGVDTCVITLTPGSAEGVFDESDGYLNYRLKLLSIMAYQDHAFWNARHALWKRIWTGELTTDLVGEPLPALRAAIVKLYQDFIAAARKKEGYFLLLSDEEQRWLVEHELEQYHEASRFDGFEASLGIKIRDYNPNVEERRQKQAEEQNQRALARAEEERRSAPEVVVPAILSAAQALVPSARVEVSDGAFTVVWNTAEDAVVVQRPTGVFGWDVVGGRWKEHATLVAEVPVLVGGLIGRLRAQQMMERQTWTSIPLAA